MNCYDCYYLRTTLKLSRKITKKTINHCSISYTKPAASCSQWLLLTDGGEPKIFKDILRQNARKNKAFKQAERCPAFCSMDD